MGDKEQKLPPRWAFERASEDLVGKRYGDDLVVIALECVTTTRPHRRMWRCRYERCGCEVFRATAQLTNILIGGCRKHGGVRGDIAYQGRTQSLHQWCQELGLKYCTAISRLRSGKPIEEVLRVGRCPRVQVELNGEVMSQADAAKRLGVTRQALSQRIKRAGKGEVSIP